MTGEHDGTLPTPTAGKEAPIFGRAEEYYRSAKLHFESATEPTSPP